MLTTSQLEPISADSQTAEAAVKILLEYIGEDPEREGLLETPARFRKALLHTCSGYAVDVAAVLSTSFAADGYDQMVLLRGIEFYSTCEHHLMPFTGTAHVAYIPGERVVGLSKLARVVDAFARRLQIQERLTAQIADAIVTHLSPKGVAVALEAQHFCMLCRGVEKQHSSMVTSAIRGAFTETAARAEFFSLIKL